MDVSFVAERSRSRWPGGFSAYNFNAARCTNSLFKFRGLYPGTISGRRFSLESRYCERKSGET